MKIGLEIIPEGNSSYSIAWTDTIGQSQGYKINTRPYELWCIIKDTKDTVGYYKGLSTPTTFTYFSTNDTSVTATFILAPNPFSNILPEEQEKKIYEGNERTIEFKPIELDIKRDLRKKVELILTEK